MGKRHLEKHLGAEALLLSNKARFIVEKCKGDITVENKKRKKMIAELIAKNYDPDPVKRWKIEHDKLMNLESQENGAQSESDDNGDNGSEDVKADDFDYLMSMPMWSLTLERKDDLLKKKNEKKKELNDLKATSKEDLWRMDLKEFIQKLDEMEKKKQEEEEKASGKLNKKKDGGRKKAMPMSPAVKGIRILPTISSELKKKASAAI